MSKIDQRLWPFKRRTSLFSAVLILVALLIVFALLRAKYGWPTDASQNIALVGILILSVLPILLVLVDVVIERTVAIEYKGIKINFSHGRDTGTVGIMVAANIGVRAKVVTDSDREQILGALAQATCGEMVVIDLEDGQAWWETRLLVLVAGAERLGRPEIIVFVGTDATKALQFQGWARARDLLPHLVSAEPQYRRSLQVSRASALQLALIEPKPDANDVPLVPTVPAVPPWTTGLLPGRYDWGVDQTTGLREELYAERLLQSELGRTIESDTGARRVSIVRLKELFQPVLLKDPYRPNLASRSSIVRVP